jgi:hypothetical protein
MLVFLDAKANELRTPRSTSRYAVGRESHK